MAATVVVVVRTVVVAVGEGVVIDVALDVVVVDDVEVALEVVVDVWVVVVPPPTGETASSAASSVSYETSPIPTISVIFDAWFANFDPPTMTTLLEAEIGHSVQSLAPQLDPIGQEHREAALRSSADSGEGVDHRRAVGQESGLLVSGRAEAVAAQLAGRRDGGEVAILTGEPLDRTHLLQLLLHRGRHGVGTPDDHEAPG